MFEGRNHAILLSQSRFLRKSRGCSRHIFEYVKWERGSAGDSGRSRAISRLQSGGFVRRDEHAADVAQAHLANDRAVLAAYGFVRDLPEEEIVARLFERLRDLVG